MLIIFAKLHNFFLVSRVYFHYQCLDLFWFQVFTQSFQYKGLCTFNVNLKEVHFFYPKFPKYGLQSEGRNTNRILPPSFWSWPIPLTCL